MPHIVDERGYNQIFATSPAQALRLRRRVQAIIAALPDNTGTVSPRILEMGCGMGEMALLLAEATSAQVTGVDLSEKFIEHARATHRRSNLDFMIADLTKKSPAADEECYDAITGNGILHHLYQHLDEVLPALRRWLKPGGRLIFWEPNLWNPYIFLIFSLPALRRAARLEPDEMAFTPGFVRRRLQRAGYGNVRVVTRDFLLPNTPAMLVRAAVTISDALDCLPLINRAAQSLFLIAEKPALGSQAHAD